MTQPPNIDECIKHYGERPEHIGPDTMVQYWRKSANSWSEPHRAGSWKWENEKDIFRLTPDYLAKANNYQLIAECEKRGFEVTKPLVTQAERDKVAAAIKAADLGGWTAFELGECDENVRAFVDAYEGKI